VFQAASSLPAGFPAATVPVAELRDGASLMDVDGLIRTILPELASPSLMVHGSLLTDGRVSYLCCGRSGSGKSTLAAMLPAQALCDELTMVRPSEPQFHGVSLPYWKARPGSAPLAGIFVLEHAREHRRSRLMPTDAMRELRQHVYWPTHEPDALARAFRTLTGLVGEVPVWRLGFRKDPAVWDLITEPAS